jgi:cell division protein FtsB
VSADRAGSAGLEERINALEQRVKQLEAEIEALKRGRRNQ